jgi:hypothetical protein
MILNQSNDIEISEDPSHALNFIPPKVVWIGRICENLRTGCDIYPPRFKTSFKLLTTSLQL